MWKWWVGRPLTGKSVVWLPVLAACLSVLGQDAESVPMSRSAPCGAASAISVRMCVRMGEYAKRWIVGRLEKHLWMNVWRWEVLTPAVVITSPMQHPLQRGPQGCEVRWDWAALHYTKSSISCDLQPPLASILCHWTHANLYKKTHWSLIESGSHFLLSDDAHLQTPTSTSTSHSANFRRACDVWQFISGVNGSTLKPPTDRLPLYKPQQP